MIKINVKKAITHYNREVRRKSQPDMTIQTLASQVIVDGRSNEQSKFLALTAWQSGDYSIRRCSVEDVERISILTGYPFCKVISQS